mmetsp:Transcript_44955/g.118772  ORF Transcript_44955/g.118772 Transcript_44955/m.118772 type:complete len:243 (-) Transcript_44955:279-1007(-)
MPKISPLCAPYDGMYSSPWPSRACTKAFADFMARCRIAVSAADQVAEASALAPESEPAPASPDWSCSRFGFGFAAGATVGAAAAEPSKPFVSMNWSNEREMLDSWSASQGLRKRAALPFLPVLLERKETFSSSGLGICGSAPPWCFARTVIAAFRFWTFLMASVSWPWNSLASFSRRAVALASADFPDATSCSSDLMVSTSPADFAVRDSMEEVRSAILASPSEMAVPFSPSLVLHQQASLS